MLRTLLAAAAVTAMLVFAGSAAAITGGTPDFAHPYVGIESNGSTACTGTLFRPTVVVTAAHCFANQDSAYGTAPDGAPLVRVSFAQAPPYRPYYTGSFYFDAGFLTASGKGLPGFDTHDVAVIVLDTPVAMRTYGQLPPLGKAFSTPVVDIVGYGIQSFAQPNPCIPSCKPQPAAGYTRAAATANVIGVGDEFVKLSANTAQDNGGVCSGDSGGPDFVHGTNVVLAENSFDVQDYCNGVTYSYRLDTRQARTFLAPYLR